MNHDNQNAEASANESIIDSMPYGRAIISSTSLAKALKDVSPAMLRAHLLPILECVLISSAGNGFYSVRATNLELDISTFSDCGQVAGPPICVNYKSLLRFLKELKGDTPININQKSDYTVELKSLNTKVTIFGFDSGEFPSSAHDKVTDPAGANYASTFLDEIDLKNLSIAYKFIGHDDLRENLSGVCITQDTMAATDAAMMFYVRRRMFSKPIRPIILPASLQKVLPKLIGPVQLERVGDMHVMLVADNISATSRVIDEIYPDWDAVIPKGAELNAAEELPADGEKANTFAISFMRQTLISSIRSVMQVVPKENPILKFEFQNSNCRLSGRDHELGCSAEVVMAFMLNKFHNPDVKPINFGCDGNKLIEILQTMDFDEVTINVTAPNRAIIIGNGHGGRGWILMPMMLGHEEETQTTEP